MHLDGRRIVNCQAWGARMSLTMLQIGLIATVLVAAGAVQGASGFGFGLVAVSLLGAVLPLKDASIMLVLAALSMNLYILLRLRQHFSLERMKWMLAGAVVGVPLGVWLLVQADETLLKRILGVVLLLTVAQGSIPFVKARRWHPLWIGMPCGLFSGALSGAFATGGPPAVAYVQSQRFDRFRYAAAVQVPLALAGAVRVVCLGAGGMFTTELLVLGIVGVACALAGAWLGLHALRRLPDQAVRNVVLTMLLVLGVKFLCWSPS
jgi:hypothetical protein